MNTIIKDQQNSKIHEVFPFSATKFIEKKEKAEEKLKKLVKNGFKEVLNQISDKYKTTTPVFSSNNNYFEENLIKVCHKNLREISLRNNKSVNLPFLVNLGSFVENLEKIDLCGLEISDEVLLSFSKSLRKLEAIDISECSGFSEQGLFKFLEISGDKIREFSAANCGSTVTCHSLSFLNLQNLKLINLSNCNNLEANFFDRFIGLKNCCLELIDFSRLNGKISSVALRSILMGSSNGLKWLNLERVILSSIDSNVLSPISDAFDLRVLNLNWFSGLNSDVLFHINPSWKKLEKLNLKGNILNDEFQLGRILKDIKNKMELDLSDNLQITDVFLISLLEKIGNNILVKLNLCSKISESQLNKIESAFPTHIILRSIMKYSNVKDSGLRIPLLPANTHFFNPKTKKK